MHICLGEYLLANNQDYCRIKKRKISRKILRGWREEDARIFVQSLWRFWKAVFKFLKDSDLLRRAT